MQVSKSYGPGDVDGVEPDVGGAEPDDAKRVAVSVCINVCVCVCVQWLSVAFSYSVVSILFAIFYHFCRL